MPEFTNPSVVEFSVLRGVDGYLWSITIMAGCMPIAVFPLLKVPHVSASAAEYTTLQIILHFLWIGLFPLGLGFIVFGDGQSLR